MANETHDTYGREVDMSILVRNIIGLNEHIFDKDPLIGFREKET